MAVYHLLKLFYTNVLSASGITSFMTFNILLFD